MTWLTPMIGGIAAAVLVPSLVILYFLKLRRRDVEISTTLLWKKSIQDLQANAPFQRLRRNILLLLQLLILGAGLVALAQPQYMGERDVGSRHVILIDRSASMGSLDGDPDRPESKTRLDAAKDEAIDLIESFREPGLFSSSGADEAMVISFDKTAEVRQSFTSDKQLLMQAVRGIEQTDSTSSLERAVRLARAHAPPRTIVDVVTDAEGNPTQRIIELPAGPVGTIHIYSDGRLRDTDEAETHPDDVVLLHPLGSTSAVNVGITSLRAGRGFDDPTMLSVFVGLTNTDASARTIDVELSIDGVVDRIRSVELPGLTPPRGASAAAGEGEEASEGETPQGVIADPGLSGTTFEFQRPQGGVITVRLDPHGDDALPTDNRAWIVVPPARQLNVAIAGEASYVIQKALASLEPAIGLEQISRDELPAALEAGTFDVIVLDKWLPAPAPDSTDPLPPGRWLIFGAVPGPPLGLTPTGTVERATVLNWSRDHAALRGLSLANAGFADATSHEVGEQSIAEVLATTQAGPAIIEMATARMHAIDVVHDVEKSIWWQDLSFPIFIAKALRYLGEEGTSGVARMVQPGEVFADRVPQGATGVTIEDPRGRRSTVVPSEDGRIVYGPVLESGIYTIRWSAPGDAPEARPFTANLLDAAESDVRTAISLSLPSQIVTGEVGSSTAATIRLWPWLLLAGLGVLMLEWFVYNRKVHV